jgi:hypothetical protein
MIFIKLDVGELDKRLLFNSKVHMGLSKALIKCSPSHPHKALLFLETLLFRCRCQLVSLSSRVWLILLFIWILWRSQLHFNADVPTNL